MFILCVLRTTTLLSVQSYITYSYFMHQYLITLIYLNNFFSYYYGRNYILRKKYLFQTKFTVLYILHGTESKLAELLTELGKGWNKDEGRRCDMQQKVKLVHTSETVIKDFRLLVERWLVGENKL